MSNDYISRQAALDAVENCEPGEELFVIKSLPSAQPEQKTGQWKLQTIRGKELVYCSECGFGVHTEETRRYSYCPNCGAEMNHDD